MNYYKKNVSGNGLMLRNDFFEDTRIRELMNQYGSKGLLMYGEMLEMSLENNGVMAHDHNYFTLADKLAIQFSTTQHEVIQLLSWLERKQMIVSLNHMGKNAYYMFPANIKILKTYNGHKPKIKDREGPWRRARQECQNAFIG